jgi:hypothetical protein
VVIGILGEDTHWSVNFAALEYSQLRIRCFEADIDWNQIRVQRADSRRVVTKTKS